MQLIPPIPRVWQHAAGNYQAMGHSAYAAFLTQDQKVRLERVRQARLLKSGKHFEYFIGEGRTQFPFPPLETVSGEVIPVYVTVNFPGLISETTADLLLGDDPILRVDDEIQQAKLTELVESASLAELLHDAAEDCSAEGEAFLEAAVDDTEGVGRVVIKRVPADEIFPEGDPGPDRQYRRYVRYSLRNAGTEKTPIWVLLESRYLVGSITRTVWQLDDAGKRGPELDIAAWNNLDAGQPPVPPVTPTGISRNTITWIPNRLSGDNPVSDYDRLLSLLDTVAAKYSQLARMMAMHADPSMYFLPGSFDANGKIRTNNKAWPASSKDEAPGYITFDGQCEAALRDRAAAERILLITARMSPALLGLKEGAAATSWKTLRLESNNTLAMIRGKSRIWAPRIRRLLSVAQDLQQTLPGERFDRYPIACEIRDGIPVDDNEQANTIATLLSVGALSRKRAVRMQLVDEAATAEEVAQIELEEAERFARNTPAILLGRPADLPANDAGEEVGSDQLPVASEEE